MLTSKITYILIIVVSLVGCQIKQSNDKLASIMKLPKFKMVSIDSSIYTSTEDKNMNTASILIYFSPNCDHCQSEAKVLLDHQQELKNVKVCMVTEESIRAAKEFAKYFGLDRLPNFLIGKDYNYSFYNIFLPSATPYIVIYDKENNLKKIYSQIVDIHSLLRNID